MKAFIFVFTFLLSVSSYAQVLNYKAFEYAGFKEDEINSEYKKSDLPVKIDLEAGQISISNTETKVYNLELDSRTDLKKDSIERLQYIATDEQKKRCLIQLTFFPENEAEHIATISIDYVYNVFVYKLKRN